MFGVHSRNLIVMPGLWRKHEPPLVPILRNLRGNVSRSRSMLCGVASNQTNGYTNTRILPLTADWSYYGDMSSYVWSQTDPNYQYVAAIAGSGISTLASAVAGSIIQMRIKMANGTYGPHTAIVEVNNTSTQMITLIESNYYVDSYTDRRGPMIYSAFVLALEGNYEYTIYQIK